MKQLVNSISILILFIVISNDLIASKDQESDSIKITKTVNEFYNWYLTSIKEKKYSAFKPKFVESKNGMTTLDYSEYFNNLKIHKFSDSLIKREKQSYCECIENLGKVKYTEFQKTIFTDLDEYQQTKCDFGNYYRWTGGQEPIDGIRINEIKFISNNSVLVIINYFETDTNEDKRYHWGENHLTLIKLDNEWFIDQIDSWKGH
nr:hypothetical protein [uncultured Carboxylicivirga sp.]